MSITVLVYTIQTAAAIFDVNPVPGPPRVRIKSHSQVPRRTGNLRAYIKSPAVNICRGDGAYGAPVVRVSPCRWI